MIFRKKKHISEKKKKFIKSSPKAGFIERQKLEIEHTLDLLGRVNFNINLKTLKLILLILGVIGFLIGMLFRNMILGSVFTVALPVLFLEYLHLKKSVVESYIEKQVVQYAELIKNSFLSTHSVITSVKNITPRMSEPCKTLFSQMINEVEVYNFSVERSLKEMNRKLHSKSLHELTEQLILCQKDQRFISSLQTTTQFMADKKEFMQIWEYRVRSMYQKLTFMVVLVNIMAASTYLMYQEIFVVFMSSKASKAILPVFVLMQILAIMKASQKIKGMQF